MAISFAFLTAIAFNAGTPPVLAIMATFKPTLAILPICLNLLNLSSRLSLCFEDTMYVLVDDV